MIVLNKNLLIPKRDPSLTRRVVQAHFSTFRNDSRECGSTYEPPTWSETSNFWSEFPEEPLFQFPDKNPGHEVRVFQDFINLSSLGRFGSYNRLLVIQLALNMYGAAYGRAFEDRVGYKVGLISGYNNNTRHIRNAIAHSLSGFYKIECHGLISVYIKNNSMQDLISLYEREDWNRFWALIQCIYKNIFRYEDPNINQRNFFHSPIQDINQENLNRLLSEDQIEGSTRDDIWELLLACRENLDNNFSDPFHSSIVGQFPNQILIKRGSVIYFFDRFNAVRYFPFENRKEHIRLMFRTPINNQVHYDVPSMSGAIPFGYDLLHYICLKHFDEMPTVANHRENDRSSSSFDLRFLNGNIKTVTLYPEGYAVGHDAPTTGYSNLLSFPVDKFDRKLMRYRSTIDYTNHNGINKHLWFTYEISRGNKLFDKGIRKIYYCLKDQKIGISMGRAVSRQTEFLSMNNFMRKYGNALLIAA